MVENIKKLMGRVEGRNTAIEVIADDLKLNPRTVSNYLTGPFYVPEKYQARIVELLHNIISQQIESLQKDLETIEVTDPTEIQE